MNNKHFVKWVTRPGSVTRDEPLLGWMTTQGLEIQFSVPTGDGNLEYYADKDEQSNLIQKVTKEISLNPLKHIAEYEELRRNMVESAQKVGKLAHGDKQELLTAYKNYFNSTADFCIYLLAPYSLKDVIEPELSKKLGGDFEKVTALGKPTVFHYFQEALLEKDPETLQKEYGWINVYAIKHKPYTLTEITEIKNKADKNVITETFKQIEENEEKFTEFLKTITDPKLKELVLLSHEYVFMRTDRIDAWKEAMFALTPFVGSLAQMIGNECELEDAGELFYWEIVSLLQDGKKPEVSELKARAQHKGVFLYKKDGSCFVSDPMEKQKILSSIVAEVGIKEIKGVVACKGKVTGPVSIILNDNDFKKFKKGDVLVAVWTEPKFTSYMQMASAIVTDEGGLTSHAAIVSRELRIPCVIGTRNATKVLKNGDIVEVDAEKGIVRKL